MRFRRTLESGHTLLAARTRGHRRGGTLSGATAFKLHDTFGFPVELTEEIAAERGLSRGSRRLRRRDGGAARTRAATARAKPGAAEASPVYRSILDAHGATAFVGYEQLDTDAEVLAIVARR